MMKRREWLLLLFILLCGFVLRLNNLSSRSLWTDEFFTLFQSSGHGEQIKAMLDPLAEKEEPSAIPASGLKPLLRNDPVKSLKDVSLGLLNTDTHPPFYFLLMHIWMRLFSDTALAVRLFSLLAGVSSIVLAFELGRLLFGRQTGFFCGLTVGISAFCVRYSQEARSYSLILALGLAASILLLRFERRGKNYDGLLLMLVNALGIYTHYFYIFIAFAQFVYFTFSHHNQTNLLRKFYLIFLLSLLLFSPWFVVLMLKGYNFYLTEWVFGYPGVMEKVILLFSGLGRYFFIASNPGLPVRILLFILWGWFGFNFLAAALEAFELHKRQFWFCLSLFILPLLLFFFIDLIEKGALLKQERFWTFIFMGFLPLAGYALNFAFLRNRLPVYIFLFFMLISAFFSSSLNFGPAPRRSAEWINQKDNNGKSCVVVYNIRSAVLAQAYYLNDRIEVLPVSTEGQLRKALVYCAGTTKSVFISRHYHRSDPSLMDQQFMGSDKIAEWGFELKEARLLDDIGVFEYAKR